MSNKHFILHLVHGTFARDAEWIQPDSPLAETIGESLGDNVHVESFNWSGSNSHTARQTAGRALANKILDRNQHDPSSSQYIVAHSHGGNVAAYALSYGDVGRYVKGVACLGTPFIRTSARNLTGSRRLVQSILIASILMALLLVAGIVRQGYILFANQQAYELTIDKMNEDLEQLKNDYGFFKNLGTDKNSTVYKSENMQFYLAGGFMLIAIGVGWFTIRPIIRLWRFALQTKLPELRNKQAELAKSLTAEFNDTPLLVIDTGGDEAAWWLASLIRVASIPYRIWRPSNFTLAGIAVLSILMIIQIYLESQPSFGSAQMLIFMALLAFFLLTLVVYTAGWALNLFWPAIFRSHALGFGKDDFLQNFIIEITSREVPVNSTRVTRHTVTVRGKGLHHSKLYQDRHVLELVSRWLKGLRQT